MSGMWLQLHIARVKGVSAMWARDGVTAVVLAHYDGMSKASDGKELVALGLW